MRALIPMLLLACLPGLALAAGAPRWDFEIRLEAPTGPLKLRSCTSAAQPAVRFEAGRSASRFLIEARRTGGGRLARSGWVLEGADWAAGECLLTRIDLAAIARADRYGLGGQPDRFWRIAPRDFLWRPAELDAESRLRFLAPPGWSASVPWRPIGNGWHRLGATPADWPASVVFGRFEERRIERPGGVLRLAVVPVGGSLPNDEVAGWIESVTDDLLHSHGRLPLPDVQILVLPLPGVRGAVPWGQVQRGGGSAVHLFPGLEAGPARWRADWTATHEFAHLLHPYLGERGRWLSEGLASYYQNVLRARSGELGRAEAWAKLAAGFERGRRATPEDAAPLETVAGQRQRGSTMRVYWAGAAFWLESDLALRRQGSSLDQALERFAREHLPSERRWSGEQYMAALQRLAPEGDWQARFRRHARAETFPDIDPRVDLLAAGRGAEAPAFIREVMQGAAGIARREAANQGAAAP
ncbi:hypothetical protein [Pseudomarimonas salicorniae]|uniref:Peptidase M61 catalytic domain-containing protein n=1 Tax=Pseudomarimonas salicorniae TaxID=2933270 RepID=A0ABT0GEV4_9GAMM|nr:hypothetical protein [Lysobacter sp. CAU 1642]MCK7592557.1 hypothetical protein [Lysobacter sp. CAU 1642]